MSRRPLIVGTAVAAVCLAAFWELAEGLAGSSRLIGFDAAVSEAIQSWRTPPLTAVMIGVTNAGDTPAVALAAVALTVAVAALGRYRQAAFSGGVILLGSILSTLAKGSFARERPPVEQALIPLPPSYSFPSGHTIGSMTLAFVMGYLVLAAPWRIVWRVTAIALWAIYAVLVGISRVYLGVHWPSDVIASWLLGGALVSLWAGVYETWFAENPGSRSA